MTDEKTIDFGFEDIPVSEKASRVRGIFDNVAGKYDLMNDVMSLGVHRLWKDMTITKTNPQPGELLIDVAGGTGDLARRFVDRAGKIRIRRGGGKARAIVCDINMEMLHSGLREDEDISRVCGDAQNLPFPDHCADVVTIAFGIRNITDRQQALKNMHRVLKPGGRFFCLEFSTPPAVWLRKIYDLYSFKMIPPLGDLLADDRDSYQYLVESIRKFPGPKQFAQIITQAGFRRAGYQGFTGGVCVLHWGFK